MEPTLFALLFGVLLVVILVAAYYQKMAAEERMAALAAMAARRGLEFMPGLLPGTLPGGFMVNLFGDHSQSEEGRLLSWFGGFTPFGQGHSPEVRNLLYGPEADLYWVVFDYSYKVTTSNGKSTTTTTYPFTVVCARVPVSLPGLRLEPENLLHRIGSKLGMQELTFESEEFNRRYFVRAPDAREAYAVLHPKALEYLLGLPPRHWQMAGPQIVIVQSGYQPVLFIEGLMSEIGGFVRLVPNYVREDHGFQAKWTGPF